VKMPNKTQIALLVSIVLHVLGVFGIVPPAVEQPAKPCVPVVAE
jgi:hypothetical protein